MPDPAKVFEGRRCPQCDGTLRWKANARCVECMRRRFREWYERIDGVRRNQLLLAHRRHKGLHRMAQRRQRKEPSGSL